MENHTVDNVRLYLAGFNGGEGFSLMAINTFEETSAESYPLLVKRTKGKLNESLINAQKLHIDVDTEQDFSPGEKAMAIRLINMAHGKKCPTISINKEIVYHPTKYT